MAKYDMQLADTKSKLASANNIIVALPSQITVDKLAAGLALYLALEPLGKSLSIVSEGTVLVAHSNLYGVGKVKNQLPPTGGGDFTLTLEGVVAADGTVPSLEKLDWFPEGSNLNLIFHVLAGQTFQPAKITPKYQGASNSLVFVIGSANLNELGVIYSNNPQVFNDGFVVNIDNNLGNTSFGKVNIADQSPSVSEIVAQVINGLGLTQNSDIASNILAGIYAATNNLTANVVADTFVTVGQAMQLGGKISNATVSVQQTPQPNQIIPQASPVIPQPIPVASPSVSAQEPVVVPSANPLASNPFLTPTVENFTMPQVSTSIPPVSTPTQEIPATESATTTTPESTSQPAPDWLTPKVYKGTSLG